MGAALLRVSKLQDKWRVKLKRWGEKYAMFILPCKSTLSMVLRERRKQSVVADDLVFHE
jgi:hypothetical protein